MQFFTKAAIAAAILLTACGKQVSKPGAPPERQDRNIRFYITLDPATARDPLQTQASLHLTVISATANKLHTEVVFDTLIPMRRLSDFPGPKEPLLIETTVSVRDASSELLGFRYQAFYRTGQKLETQSGSGNFPAGNNHCSAAINL